VDRKATVRRFIDEAVNGGRDELVDELVADELRPGARDWFGAFRSSFPDVHMETVELVADGETVVGRFRCSATHLGEWRGNRPPLRGRRRGLLLQVRRRSDRRAVGYRDTLDRFRQLGLDPA